MLILTLKKIHLLVSVNKELSENLQKNSKNHRIFFLRMGYVGMRLTQEVHRYRFLKIE